MKKIERLLLVAFFVTVGLVLAPGIRRQYLAGANGGGIVAPAPSGRRGPFEQHRSPKPLLPSMEIQSESTGNASPVGEKQNEFNVHNTDDPLCIPSNGTLEDVIEREFDLQGASREYSDPKSLCHFTVPFSPNQDGPCIQVVRRAVELMGVLHPKKKKGSPPEMVFEVQKGRRYRIELAPIRQRFEQRTIKFKMTVTDDGKEGVFLVKVPQRMFPIEPFSEVMAFHLDRILGVDRIPPTLLLPIPLALLEQMGSLAHDMKMVAALQKGNQPQTYREWIDEDLVKFVTDSHRRSKYMHNATHILASIQLWLPHVEPLLGSVFRAPYSKKNPGWHRWMNPAYIRNGTYRGSYSVQLALSELTIFDYIIMNNDRSPNKNNFVISACKKHRGEKDDNCGIAGSGGVGEENHLPTFVHLDQGMSFLGHHLDHNPMGKTSNRNTFCLLYKPLVSSIACRPQKKEYWSSLIAKVVEESVLETLGKDVVQRVSGRVLKVLGFARKCLAVYPEAEVLQP